MLCSTCSLMFRSYEWGNHHPDLKSFTNAAANGCYICEPLLHFVVKEASALENCMSKPYTYRIYRGNPYEDGVSIHIDMSILRGGLPEKVCANYVAFATTTVDISIRDRKSEIPFLQAAEASGRWVSNCLKGHKQCQKNTQPGLYPTRLLELAESSFRVILSSENKLSGPYATLSYCWGHRSFIRLTASNISELQAGIPYSSIPTAFQEAIRLCQNLNIRYLWIDAFCIIQSGPGSIEDWHFESARMADVYSNSSLTIALSRAPSPNESCLGGLTLDTTIPFEVEAPAFFKVHESTKGTCIVMSSSYYFDGLCDQPLGFRAWALQERLLSPRVLSLGLGELFWECSQLTNASECFPRGLPLNLRYEKHSTKTIPSTSDYRQLENFWLDFLRDYADRELTYPEMDKLVALSAVAKQMATAMDDVYIAGHFWKMLPVGLNWQLKPPLADFKRRNTVAKRITTPVRCDMKGNTPSWSWASIDGPIFPAYRHNSSSFKSPAVAISYAVTPVDKTNPQGQVLSAKLIIEAYCAEVQWRQRKPELLGENSEDEDRLFLEVNMDSSYDEPADGNIHLLVVLVEDSWLCQWEGLVLQEIDLDSEKTYKRVGHFIYQDNIQQPDFWKLFQKLFHQKRKLTLV